MSLLWTVVPPERIFDDSSPRRFSLYQYLGRLLYVEDRSGGDMVIVQLLSTDPADFLDPAFAPGQSIGRKIQKIKD